MHSGTSRLVMPLTAIRVWDAAEVVRLSPDAPLPPPTFVLRFPGSAPEADGAPTLAPRLAILVQVDASNVRDDGR